MSLARQSSSALKSRRTRSVGSASGPRGIQPGWTAEAPMTSNTRHAIRERHWEYLTKAMHKKSLAASTSFVRDDGEEVRYDAKSGQTEMAI